MAGGKHFVSLAPSVDRTRGAQKVRGYEIDIVDLDDLTACDLSYPVRFAGNLALTLSLGHIIRHCGAAPLPRGRLRGRPSERLQAVRARLVAEADMAAERRSARRRPMVRPVSVPRTLPRQRLVR